MPFLTHRFATKVAKNRYGLGPRIWSNEAMENHQGTELIYHSLAPMLTDAGKLMRAKVA